MIPTIEDIVAGLLDSTIGREQAIAWLRTHSEIPSEDRMMIAATALQGILVNLDPEGQQWEDAPRRSVAIADALLDALQRTPGKSGSQ